jgi:hypothetical protein
MEEGMAPNSIAMRSLVAIPGWIEELIGRPEFSSAEPLEVLQQGVGVISKVGILFLVEGRIEQTVRQGSALFPNFDVVCEPRPTVCGEFRMLLGIKIRIE